MLICYLGHDQVYVDTSRKNEKEGVVLLFLKVALFENSNKGEGGVDPFYLTLYTLYHTHLT